MKSQSSHSLANLFETPNTMDLDTHHDIIDDGSSRKRAREVVSTQKLPLVPKKKSSYWDHCEKFIRKVHDGSLQQIGICNYCKVERSQRLVG